MYFLVFSGRRIAGDNIASWVIEHSGLPAVELTDVEAAKECYKDEVVVVGFFESNTSDKAAAYLAATGVTDSVSFAITKSSEIAKALEVEMEIVVDYWRSRHPIAVKGTNFKHKNLNSNAPLFANVKENAQ